ncbi:5-oxoprolinase subunit PxpB [Escherichia coli]|nr:5-oxoprolinase subunit PxpB [Escherichia coli]MCN9469126.1 5-oxoprolinase subunit PxpB [Escherichia coli]
MQRARCYLIGETAVVLELEPPVTLASQKRIWRLAQRLVNMPNVVEAIPGMNNITVILRNPESLALDAIERLQRWWEESEALALDAIERLQRWWEESEALEPESRFIEIPVVYGGAAGPDLAVVAAHCGLSEKQVVELHSSVEYVVWFLGFQPGFPYLGSLPEQLHTPRRAEPRLHVPAGSVGIGGPQTGVYPLATPGGWQLVGHTSLSLFDPERDEPILLRPGDSVRFVPQKEGVC